LIKLNQSLALLQPTGSGLCEGHCVDRGTRCVRSGSWGVVGAQAGGKQRNVITLGARAAGPCPLRGRSPIWGQLRSAGATRTRSSYPSSRSGGANPSLSSLLKAMDAMGIGLVTRWFQPFILRIVVLSLARFGGSLCSSHRRRRPLQRGPSLRPACVWRTACGWRGAMHANLQYKDDLEGNGAAETQQQQQQ
jgi:hypothetical protein